MGFGKWGMGHEGMESLAGKTGCGRLFQTWATCAESFVCILVNCNSLVRLIIIIVPVLEF